MDRVPYVVRAFHDRSRIAEEVKEEKRWARRRGGAQTRALRELLELILKNAELHKWNSSCCKLVLPSQVSPSKRLVGALAKLGMLSADECP